MGGGEGEGLGGMGDLEGRGKGEGGMIFSVLSFFLGGICAQRMI